MKSFYTVHLVASADPHNSSADLSSYWSIAIYDNCRTMMLYSAIYTQIKTIKYNSDKVHVCLIATNFRGAHNFRGLVFSKISQKQFSQTEDTISILKFRGA